MQHICTAVVATLALVGTSFAATINVPGDHATIQGAVDAATTGDLILVSPGTYTSNGQQVVDMLGKEITLRSTQGSGQTIIDGQGQRRGLVCHSGETRNTLIDGFTITGGSASAINEMAGGNVFCNDSSPTIQNCTIITGEAFFGGGIYSKTGGPSVEACFIADNVSSGSGGGANLFQCTEPIEILDCTFFENQCGSEYAGGAVYAMDCLSLHVSGCLFDSNVAGELPGSEGGGGVYIHADNDPISDIQVSECTFEGNSAGKGGGISILTWGEPNTTIAVTACTFHTNQTSSAGGGGYVNCLSNLTPSNVSFINCDFDSNSTDGVGGGLWAKGALVIEECRIHDNQAPFSTGSGGGLYSYVYGSATPPPLVSNTYICGNMPDQISGPIDDVAGNYVALDCPTGACCSADQCEQLSEADCYDASPGGTWLGWNSSCEDCLSTQEGACCLAEELRGAGCVITDPSACFQLQGKWMGPGTDCTACIPPPQPGACCTTTGCMMMLEGPDVCASFGGLWLGEGVDCDECPETAACCLCNGCLPLWEEDCLIAGGKWLPGMGCDDCPPLIERGTCCLSSGCMLSATEDECLTHLGKWLGQNGNCTDCPQPCPGDLNGDWIVDIDDLLILLGSYGPCP